MNSSTVFKILLVCNILFFGFESKGQSDFKNLSINYVAESQEIKEILKDLENKYGLRFSYSTEALVLKEKPCQFKDESLADVIDYLIGDESMEYKILDNNILLRKKNDFKELENERYQNSIHLKGKVVYEQDQNNLAFASVYIPNSSIGTYTDENGEFDIEIPEKFALDSITIHYLGFEDKHYQIKDLEEEYLLYP